MLYLRKASRPYLTEYEFNEVGELREAGEKRQRPIPAISIVHVEGELFFGAAELFRTQIQKICLDPDLRIVILRLKNARHLDATSVMALEELVRFVRSAGRDLALGVHCVVGAHALLQFGEAVVERHDGCAPPEGLERVSPGARAHVQHAVAAFDPEAIEVDGQHGDVRR